MRVVIVTSSKIPAALCTGTLGFFFVYFNNYHLLRLSSHSLLIVKDLITLGTVAATPWNGPGCNDRDDNNAAPAGFDCEYFIINSCCSSMSACHETVFFFLLISGGREMGDTTKSRHLTSRIHPNLTMISTL